MCGVDLLDQSISYHTINHRSKKWWRRLFFYGMMVSAHNAYVVAKDQGHTYHSRQWPTFLDFLEDLSNDLIGDTRADRAPQLPRAPERRLQVHTPERMFDKRRACRECSFSRQPNERVQATNFGCSSCQKQILEFFKPIKPKQVKVPRRNKGVTPATTVATAQFSTEKDWEMAMRRNKNFIGAKKIYLHKVKVKVDSTKDENMKARPWETKKSAEEGNNVDGNDEDETVAESGRLFARNLPYCCTENELEELFGKYGQLTEVHLPIDSFTRKMKGFAFITFMMPEHAVKAYTALDGTTFQGRMLHLLPGKAKKEEEVSKTTDENSYKKKKEAKLKATAGSSHNWNTLFLGANAVADVMAERYGASKSDILNAEGKQSVGVRLALGETQVVAETRGFLIDNGVALDSFSQAAAARSKTVILVKNLPANTSEEEIKTIFERFGHLGRVVLPPSGITAIVEFLEPSEARNAFRGLAYTKFKYAPLYLEWAP
ncbi:putative RNA-binding protein 19 [Lamellibrachia satsuma]|nr:putative RNA-binding protein 19 [Lamellibrachia satsuma]